ncbi:hypothetical protein IWW48_005025 [Coemansia sp. RSA 1200]|nr:hypothetical protein IWW48_005025 [Coemansia sp. RSA 1200]
MITPRFTVRQDDASVYITIHAPHVRAQSLEFDVSDDQFTFFASPYYLRLTFPGSVVEDEAATASFDAAAGDISVTLSKLTHGEHFKNLDLLTGLLATRRERERGPGDVGSAGDSGGVRRPAIEEIGTSGGQLGDEERAEMLMDEEFDWEIPQTVNTDTDADDSLINGVKYGFNQQYSGILAHVYETANEVNELPSPESMSLEERRLSRVASENAKFDEDYYVENYLYDDDIVPLIRFNTPNHHILKRIQRLRKQEVHPDDDSSVAKLTHNVQQNITADSKEGDSNGTSDAAWDEFTDDERKTMLDLPRRTYLISQKQTAYLGLIDILFAYSLDYRINMGEHTVESAWAIGVVSSLFSNLDQFVSLRDVVIACFRRGLAYPLYRNWELCERSLEDVYVILKLGKRAVLKAMLEIKGLFDHHDLYYVYSKLFIDDYCVWLQTGASEKALQSLAHQVHGIEIAKDETDWPLDEYEDLALQTSESEDEGEETIDEDGRPLVGAEVDHNGTEATEQPDPEVLFASFTLVEGLLLLASWRISKGEQQNTSSTGDDCHGYNTTYVAQCLRLYGGTEFKNIPNCAVSYNKQKLELSVDGCLENVGNSTLNIPGCNASKFGTEFPQPYKQCISDHSGVVYKIDCNDCVCQCNGYSMCTKKGCVHLDQID